LMEQFFPDLTQDLVSQGALSGDTQEIVRWYAGGGRLASGQSGLRGLAVAARCSRATSASCWRRCPRCAWWKTATCSA
jgi:hypothetical protein